MGKLSFFIALPRAGKTTFSKEWREKSKNRVVLSFDDFRYAITGQRFYADAEDFVRASVFTAARALLRGGFDVLLDDTFSSLRNINQVLHICPDAHAIILHTPWEVCNQRALETGQADLLAPINRMLMNLNTSLSMIASGELKLKSFEEIGPEFRWIRKGYWGKYID